MLRFLFFFVKLEMLIHHIQYGILTWYIEKMFLTLRVNILVFLGMLYGHKEGYYDTPGYKGLF